MNLPDRITIVVDDTNNVPPHPFSTITLYIQTEPGITDKLEFLAVRKQASDEIHQYEFVRKQPTA